MKRNPIKPTGFSLLEVIVGTSLIALSSVFTISILSSATRSAGKLAMRTSMNSMEEQITRSALERFLNIYFSQSALPSTVPSGFCNLNINGFGIGNLNSEFDADAPQQNLHYELVSATTSLPVIGSTIRSQFNKTVATGYMAARDRCLGSQTHQIAPVSTNGGHFGNVPNLYLCAKITPVTGGWVSNQGAGGKTLAAQTILAEFNFQINNVTAQPPAPVDCAHLVDFPMSVYPGMSSPLIATLTAAIHTVDTLVDVSVANAIKVNYRYVSSQLRSAPHFNPRVQQIYSGVVSTYHGPNSLDPTNLPGGRAALPVATGFQFYPLARFVNCAGVDCRNWSQLFNQVYNPAPSPAAPVAGQLVVVDLELTAFDNAVISGNLLANGKNRHQFVYYDTNNPATFQSVGGVVTTPPSKPNWNIVAGITDCWPSASTDFSTSGFAPPVPPSIFCFGNLTFGQKTADIASLGAGAVVLTGLYSSPEGSGVDINLDCGQPNKGSYSAAGGFPAFAGVKGNTNSPCCPRHFRYLGNALDCSAGGSDPNVACNTGRKLAFCAHFAQWPSLADEP